MLGVETAIEHTLCESGVAAGVVASAVVDEIPVLDLADYDVGGTRADDFVTRLGDVVHDVGFFQLVGHGVDAALLRHAVDVATEFFALPDADRFEIDNVKSPQFRGYTRFGHEHTNGRVDLRDQIDIGRELPPP